MGTLTQHSEDAVRTWPFRVDPMKKLTTSKECQGLTRVERIATMNVERANGCSQKRNTFDVVAENRIMAVIQGHLRI